MRKILILGWTFIFIVVSCSPSAPLAATIVPTHIPSLVPTKIVENTPACNEADLIYHTQLQQMLLVNCVEDPSKETPGVIWGWDGTQWQRVTEGGPPGRILGGGGIR